MSDQSSAPIVETPVDAELAQMEADIADVESIDMSNPSGEEKIIPQGESSQAEVDQAAAKVKAKEVKGSDGDLFKIKVDGQEIEVKREEMVRLAQMGKAGQKAMQEKAELQKSMASFIQALKDNPGLVLAEDLGIDITELAQQTLAKKFEEEAKSPEQRRVEEMEAKLQKYEREQKEREEKREKDEFDAEVSKYEQELESQVTDAFTQSGLPRKPVFLKRMADLLEGAYERNLDVSPAKIAKLIKEDWINETREALAAFDDDALENTLGGDMLTRLRKSQLKKARAAVPSAKVNTSAASIKVEEKPKKVEKLSMKDFLKGVR